MRSGRGRMLIAWVLASTGALSQCLLARVDAFEQARPQSMSASAAPLPQSLAETGLYADAARLEIAPDLLAFSPQYPLWSDGASKRRWLMLPQGKAIDASDPDAWVFPIGSRLWKEFSLQGRPVETRYSERLADGSWRFATYIWNAEGTAAELAPELGRRLAVEAAPGGRYEIPSRGDCQACHAGAPSPVLGFSALQLSSDRDPGAPHAEALPAGALDLDALVVRGLLVNLPASLQAKSPRIAATTAEQRAALGYLHGNCGHCHHRGAGAAGVPVDLVLAQSLADEAGTASVLQSLGGHARYRPRGWSGEPRLLVPGNAKDSLLLQRMRSRDPLIQMPPLGTRLADAEALALIERWIETGPSFEPEGEPQ
jgi:hypothetical protein